MNQGIEIVTSESEQILSNVKKQVFATVIANIVIFSHGCCVGWVSPALPVLLSDDTPITTGPISNEQLSWVGSMSNFGSICGTFIFGTLTAFLGSKRSMIFLAFPQIIFWLLILFGDTYYHIIIGRLAAGISGGGIQTGVVLFVAEISNNNIRGRLGSFTPLIRNIGLLIGFFVGGVVRYEYRPYVFISLPIIYLIWLFYLPNTPQYYLKNADFDRAEKALMFYKNCDGNNDREKTHLNAEMERLKLIDDEQKNSPKIQMNDFCNRMALKGVIVSVAVSWLCQMTGGSTFTNYASFMFEKSGTSLGIHISSIILAVAQIVGGLISTQLGDTFGRKTTLNISLLGSAGGLFTFATFMYLHHIGYDLSNFLWIPVTSLSLIIFISYAGIQALINTCVVECFSPKIRTIGMIFYSFCLNGIAFGVDKTFPILLEIIGMHSVMLIMAINCCLGIVFIAFMKETKGQSIDTMDTTSETKSPANNEQNKA
ncbi:facilitated trehalose transporter Tret1-like [Sitodiplosis mosellana]|uniref:facilitated trehalose transporter Tret1-like n=1 Tax=Sitodiplosis mosellana TaxID=263140 RepID=UPI002443FC3D|nr:facilitated trehalose transporter Tret1-like [Sitodiplosis mosellana]